MIIPAEVRKSILQMCYASGEGHIPSSFSVVEILAVLYDGILKYQAANPAWDGRDYFILSKGHASAALYTILAIAGFFSEKDLSGFAEYDSLLGGHPDRNKVPGVEASTGSLGHGFPFAAGLALGLKIQARTNKVYALIGDGESNEGSVWETAMVAAHRKLNNLTGILDANNSQTRCLPLTDIAGKWKAFGWNVYEVDGHDMPKLWETFKSVLSLETDSPTMVIAYTVKGKGSKLLEDNAFAWHHKGPMENEYKTILEELK